MRYVRWMVIALFLVQLAALSHGAAGVPRARAQVAAAVGFDPASGAMTDLRVVSFSGFGSGETLDFTFTDPTGAAANVGDGTTWYAVTQDDGTGSFEFTPSDWLTPLAGTWTVTITGETSGMQTTAIFVVV
ncbi:MAG TPA: hypothetical protein VKV26_02655 [Dehalococcoidia bacterium]|nr:hypothetical protein [Dehalococcoidia bacterium]